jgi:coenzyme F420-reducing hydrogenase gamma subunit
MECPAKPRVAFFDFACCEGCQLSVLALDEQLLQLLQHVDIVEFREAMSESSDDYDIAFCEGSITRERDIERAKRIRATADIVVSLGSCATVGCHNALKNKWPMAESLKLVYGDMAHHFDTIPARPLTAVVPVDYQISGCPVSMPELLKVLKYILTGREYRPPNQPVCVECKLKDNLCVLEKGIVCMGPVTRCGCDAICTSYGGACQGCRGLMDEANWASALNALSSEHRDLIMRSIVTKWGLGENEILEKLRIYNNWPELTTEGIVADG